MDFFSSSLLWNLLLMVLLLLLLRMIFLAVMNSIENDTDVLEECLFGSVTHAANGAVIAIAIAARDLLGSEPMYIFLDCLVFFWREILFVPC